MKNNLDLFGLLFWVRFHSNTVKCLYLLILWTVGPWTENSDPVKSYVAIGLEIKYMKPYNNNCVLSNTNVGGCNQGRYICLNYASDVEWFSGGLLITSGLGFSPLLT